MKIQQKKRIRREIRKKHKEKQEKKEKQRVSEKKAQIQRAEKGEVVQGLTKNMEVVTIKKPTVREKVQVQKGPEDKRIQKREEKKSKEVITTKQEVKKTLDGAKKLSLVTKKQKRIPILKKAMKEVPKIKKKLRSAKRTIIQVSNLIKDFTVGTGTQRVLKKINLCIYKKDLTIIYGPSGCGKSTLLNVICGLEVPTSGKVFVRNKDVYEMDEHQRARFRAHNFGIVYQMTYWLNALTVLENVAIPLLVQGKTQNYAFRKARRSLIKVGLVKFANYIPTELSGGQQQKVAVARAIVSNPRIIIADEPTGNLDSKSGGELMELFLYLKDSLKKTIIMVTHNMAYLIYATRKIGMKDGDIMETKDIEKLDELIEIIKPGVMYRKNFHGS